MPRGDGGCLGGGGVASPAASPAARRARPFALSDPDRLSDYAVEAGLTPCKVIEGETYRTYPDLATGLRGPNARGVAIRAAGVAGEAAASAAHAPFR